MNGASRVRDVEELSRLLAAVGKDRDTEAFTLLFELLAPRIRAFVARSGDSFADDVVQETFVNIWKKAHLYDAEKAPATAWIYAVARNVKIDFARKISRMSVDAHDPTFVGDPIASPHQAFSQSEEAARLSRAVEGLPAEQSEILRLAFFSDKAHSEIAAQLGLPLGTVKSRIRLAMERLRKEIGEDIA